MFKSKKIVSLLLVLILVFTFIGAATLSMEATYLQENALSGIVDFEADGGPQTAYDNAFDSIAVNWGSIRQAAVIQS